MRHCVLCSAPEAAVTRQDTELMDRQASAGNSLEVHQSDLSAPAPVASHPITFTPQPSRIPSPFFGTPGRLPSNCTAGSQWPIPPPRLIIPGGQPLEISEPDPMQWLSW